MKRPSKGRPRGYAKDDRLKMGILYFLTNVIKGNGKRGEKAPLSVSFLRKVVTEPEYCKTFPWGRYTFLDNLKQIKKLLTRMNGKVTKKHVTFPGYILSLELLAFEAIPALMKRFREEDEERLGCPRMCKTKFQYCSGKGWSLSDLYEEIGDKKDFESILKPREDERELLSELFDPEEEHDLIDVVVDSWTTRLKEGRSVWFEDLCKADILGREEEPRPDEPVLESSTPKKTANARKSGERSIRSVVAELNEVKEIMADGFKGWSKKIEEICERQEEIAQTQKDIVLRQEDMESRLVQVEGMVVQLSATVGKEPMIIPPAPTHTGDTSVGETKEKNRKKGKKEKKKEKDGDDDLEDITPEQDDGEPGDKEMGETKAPGKKRKNEQNAENEQKADNDGAPENKRGKKRKTKRVSRVGL